LIIWENGIVHRLTQPATPTTTGKVERFHQPLRRELLDDVPVWPDLDTVQAAIDAFRYDYNTDRPHQSLDMAFPAERFRPADRSWFPSCVSGGRRPLLSPGYEATTRRCRR
jgi:transposase InsO family protein